MKENEIIVCRNPGYWNGSCSSTPKNDELKKTIEFLNKQIVELKK